RPTIETSRSDMELLQAFDTFEYPIDIGPGVYDIHSPNIPTREEIIDLMQKAGERIPVRHPWVKPQSTRPPSRHLGGPTTTAQAAPALESILACRVFPQGLTEEYMKEQAMPNSIFGYPTSSRQVPKQPDEALLYRVPTAQAKLGVSRSTIYRLVNEGELVLIKIGKRSSGITAASVHALIERNKALAS